MSNKSEIINEAVGMWERTGLLQGLEGKEKQFCAMLMQELCRFIITNKDEVSPSDVWEFGQSEPFYSLIFPVARVLVGAHHYPQAKWLLKDFGDFYEANKSQIDLKDDNSEPAFVQTYLAVYPQRMETTDQQA